jgi:GntR family transcriptional regulator
MGAKALTINQLPISVVDSHSPVPLYHQIYLDLKQMIQQEIVPPGSTLPPELDICQAYGVGRQTVRMAIARLVDDNLVERYAGRGTFVKSQADRLKFYLNRSFTQQAIEMGYRPHSKLICQEGSTLDKTYPAVFEKFADAPCLNIERLRYGDHLPICYQSTTVLTQDCPGIEKHDFSHESLYEVLATHYRMIIHSIDYTVRAVAADEYRAELLNVQAGAPLLFVATSAFLEDGHLVESTASYYRADRYEYTTTQTYTEK